MEKVSRKERLTDRFVASKKVTGKERVDIADEVMTGLTLRVSASSKVWWLRFRRMDGTQTRVRLGHYVPPEYSAGDADALTVAGARIKARKLRSAVDEGKDPASEKRLAKAEAKAQPIKTVKDMAEAYFSSCASGEYRPARKVKKAKSLQAERNGFRWYVEKQLGDVRVEALSRDAVRKLLRDLVASGRGVTANRVRSLLHAIYVWGVAERRVTTNPVAEVPKPVVEKPRDRILTDDELRTLWACLNDPKAFTMPDGEPVEVSRPVRIALTLSLLTMQRRGEIASMRVQDIDFENSLWTIPAEFTKAGRRHTVPLASTSVALIREAMALRTQPDDAPSPWVFPGKRDAIGVSIDPSALSQAMRDIRKATGIDGITTHDARRSGATRLAEDGVSPFDIGLCLNHAGERGGTAMVTLSTYVKATFLREKTHAMLTLERLILQTVGEREAVGNVVALRG